MLRVAFNRAWRVLLQRDHHGALRWLLACAVRLFPGDPQLRMQYGATLAVVKRDAARDQLVAGVALAADEARLLVYAASQLYWLGELELARDALARASELDVREGWVLDEIVHQRGMLAFQDGHFEEAERLLWEAVHLDPSDAMFLNGLVEFLVDRGRVDEASSVLNDRRPKVRRPELLRDRTVT